MRLIFHVSFFGIIFSFYYLNDVYSINTRFDGRRFKVSAADTCAPVRGILWAQNP